MEHLYERPPLLNGPQGRMMARLTGDNQVDVGILQDIVPAARADAEAAHAGRLDVGADGARDHDVLEAAELGGDAEQDLGERDGRVKGARGAVTRGGVRLRGRFAGDGDGARRAVRAGNHVGEPGVEAVGGGVDGRVRAVDGDAGLGEVQQRRLLGVLVGDGLEAAEDEWIW